MSTLHHLAAARLPLLPRGGEEAWAKTGPASSSRDCCVSRGPPHRVEHLKGLKYGCRAKSSAAAHTWKQTETAKIQTRHEIGVTVVGAPCDKNRAPTHTHTQNRGACCCGPALPVPAPAASAASQCRRVAGRAGRARARRPGSAVRPASVPTGTRVLRACLPCDPQALADAAGTALGPRRRAGLRQRPV